MLRNPDQPTSRSASGYRHLPWHVLAWSALAFAQPLFDMLTRTPEFLVARSLTPAQILMLAASILLLPTGLFVAGAELAGRVAGPRVRRSVYLGALGLCAAALVALVLRRIPADRALIVTPPAVVAGAAFVWLYLRARWLRLLSSLLAWLAPAPLLLFLASPAVIRLLLPADPAAGLTASPPAAQAPVPVVMVVLDELPASTLVREDGRVDATLFPHLARLEATATRHPNHSAAAIKTLEAIPPLLTGRYPQPGFMATLKDYPGNLFTILSGSHRIYAFETMTQLCPEEFRWHGPPERLSRVLADLGVLYLHLSLPTELSAKLPGVTTKWSPLDPLEEKGRPVRDFVDSLPRSWDPERPPFVFLHLTLPHHPWIYYPSGRRYYPGTESSIDGIADADQPLPGHWVDDPWATRQALQRHLLQMSFTDQLVGRLFEHLRTTELFDDALIVVTSDHGISFRPSAKVRAVGPASLEDVAGVPLWIKLPGQTRPSVDDRPTAAVNLAPTVAAALGFDLPWQTDGESLLGSQRVLRRPRAVFNQPTDGIQLNDNLPLLRERHSAVERWRAFPADPPSPERLFDLVPEFPVDLRTLLDREISDLLGDPAAFRAELDSAERFIAVDPEADPLPGRITGRLLGPALDRETRPVLALALNGRIRAITLPRIDPSAANGFSFLVPETVWQEGDNAPALFEVVGTDREFALHPVAIPPSVTYRLDLKQDRVAAIESSADRRYAVGERAAGLVTDQILRGRDAWISYRAVVPPQSGAELPMAVLAFRDGEFLRAETHRRVSPRIETFFRFDLLRRDAAGDLRFFLLDGSGRAHPLEFRSGLSGDDEPLSGVDG